MKLLAIETSCDETAVSILKAEGPLGNPAFIVLGNALYSQAKLHEAYGGVYPSLAKREHAKNLPSLLEHALNEAKMQRENHDIPPSVIEHARAILVREPELAEELIRIASVYRPEIDAITVTYGPGLEPALWVGISAAEALGVLWNIPIVPVNHMEGHIASVLSGDPPVKTPLIALLISGGHTELVLSEKPLSFHTIGKTRDDAIGEAYDKAARMLGLPYPGGPEIAKLAEEERDIRENRNRFDLPRPMLTTPDLDFSFSGLKTAVLYKLRELGELSPDERREFAREFEDAVTEVLLTKTRKAIEKFHPKSLIIGGGVIANPYIRKSFKQLLEGFPDIQLFVPGTGLSTDNSVMIGMAGYLRIIHDPDLLEKNDRIIASGTATLGE